MSRRVVVLGGAGYFGRIIARRLALDSRFDVMVAGRRAEAAADAARALGATALLLDREDRHFARRLRDAGAWCVVDAAGPFQDRDHRVPRACAEAGIHAVDIADGREYVCGIVQLDAIARASGALVVSGASSVPALSGAGVDHLARGLAEVHGIDFGISTSGRSPGAATAEAILAYCGRAIPGWSGGRAVTRRGWGASRRREIGGIGPRWMADCDVPDMTLLPARYPGLRELRFGAGSESTLLHGLLRAWSRAVQAGWPAHWHPPARWVVAAWNRVARSSGRSALFVELVGCDGGGRRLKRTWTLVASGEDGANIPALPAIALVRRLAEGRIACGRAVPCIGLLSLDELCAEMEGLRLTTAETEEYL